MSKPLAVFPALLMAGLLVAGAASAQSRVWNFGDTTAPGSCPTGGGTYTAAYGNSLACSVQPSGTATTVTATSFANTGTTGTTYATAAINYQGVGSGIGSYNQIEGLTAGSPDHAFDNNGSSDMLLLSFTTSQVLKSVTLGWAHTDSDFQVLRWTGTGAAAAIVGRTAAQLLTDGWALVSAVNGGATGSTDTTYGINGSNLSSSYWLISAYNSAFGGANNTAGVDAFKLLAVAAVPLPGTLALVGLGLFCIAAQRRRQQRGG